MKLESGKHTGKWLAAAALGLAVALCGCNQESDRGTPLRSVSLAEFTQPEGAPTHPSAAAIESAAAPRPNGEPPSQDAPPPDDVTMAAADEPPPSEPRDGQPASLLRRPGERAVIEGMVGQVNGRPIFIEEFFDQPEDYILAERAKRTPQDFARFLDDLVTALLLDQVNSELVVAEAESQLTPVQQEGLLAWMKELQERTIAQRGGGTRSQAELQLQGEDGSTLEDYLNKRKDKALIDKILSERVDPRIVISRRDIEREFTLQQDLINPPPQAVFAAIIIPTRMVERIDEVTTRLANDEPFADVAQSLGFKDGGRLDPFTVPPGGIADIQSIREEVREHVKNLSPGQIAGPFELGSATHWWMLVEITSSETRTIYDAQVQRGLKNLLKAARRRAEVDRYTAYLRERWVADDLEAMRQRLLAVARDRYLRY